VVALAGLRAVLAFRRIWETSGEDECFQGGSPSIGRPDCAPNQSGRIRPAVPSPQSESGLELLAQARARKAIVEKAKTPPYSSRTSAIIVALRFPRDYAMIIKAADLG
jgi:hypothetical protein